MSTRYDSHIYTRLQDSKGWTLSYDEPNVCTSSLTYTGPCSSKLMAANNIRDKTILHETCKLEWPCQIVCDKDYSTCPKYWYMAENKCHSTRPLSGRCYKGMELKHMDLSEKILWSNTCSIDWNCLNDCKKDYSQICPKDWNLIGGTLCEAPLDYTGPCFKIADLSYFNRKMKTDFETVCNVMYPCI